MVSTPSSSASSTAASTASASPMPTSGPSANALSYSTRAEPPLFVFMMRSQPIEHEAQESRTAARSSSTSGVVSAPKLWPGSAESALNVRRFESVPASRYLAVAGPNERARRSFAAASTAAGSCTGARRCARTATALSSLDPITAPRPPRPAWRPSCDTVAKRTSCSPAGPMAATRYAGPSRSRSAASACAAGRPQRSPAGSSRGPRFVDHERARLRAGAAHHDRVVARALARDREVARGQRVVEPLGQRRLGHDGELGARRERRADERGEDEGERRRGRERVAAVGSELRQQVRAEAGAADRAPQHVVAQGQRLRAPVAEVHDQGLAEVAARGHDSKGTRERAQRTSSARHGSIASFWRTSCR